MNTKITKFVKESIELKIWTLFVILVISIAIVIIINVWIGLAYMIMIWIAVHLICNHYELKRSKRELGKE